MSQIHSKSQAVDWEVINIVQHKIINSKWFFLIEWKPTIHFKTNYEVEILPFKQEIENIQTILNKNQVLYKVIWKNKWMKQQDLTNCDELIGTYLLLNTKKIAFNIIKNQ